MMRRHLIQLDNDERTPDTLIFAAQSIVDCETCAVFFEFAESP